MHESPNVETIKRIYAAFMRGDIPAILQETAQDAEWTVPGPSVIPYAATWRGHQEIERFIVTIGTNVEIMQFSPQHYIGHGNEVVVIGAEEGRVRENGCIFRADWVMVWTLLCDKAVTMREYTDTAAIADAFRGHCANP